MKTLISSLIFSLVVASLAAQDTTDYFAKFGKNLIPVVNRTGGAESKLFLANMLDGDLLFRYSKDNPSEIGIPLDTPGLLIYYPPNKVLNDAITNINDGIYGRPIENMRPYVYPMVKFLTIPEKSFNIHPYVERFAYALVQDENTEDEALAFFRKLPLESLSPAFTAHAMTLVERLIANGRSKDSLVILNNLPFQGNETLLPRIMRFANKLRTEGNIEEALFMYQRVQDVDKAGRAQLAQLWMAYCNLLLDRVETSKIFLEQVGDIKTDNPSFSLQQLVLGRIELAQGQVEKAMSHISRGVVYTDVVADWAPEISYTSGFCYEELGKPDAAREVYNEVILFYPNTEWGQKSVERRDALPAKKPQEEGA